MASKKEEGPDQIRSWAIALAACVINTLLSGIMRTTGLFYVALIDTYGVSRLQANLPFTTRNAVRNLAGPIVGVIGQRYGPRDVTIVGGVFASLGILLCTFAPNVIWITILWGGMHGFGVALGNTLFQVIVTQYFVKYRATASGLALSGGCLGSFVLPILIEHMLANLGLSGTFLVTGGLIMHVLPASILLKIPPWIRRQTKTEAGQGDLALMTSPKKTTKPTQKMSMIQEDSNDPTDFQDLSIFNSKKIPSTENLDPKKVGNYTNCTSLINVASKGIDNPGFVESMVDLSEKTDRPTDQLKEEGVDCRRHRSISFGEVSITLPVLNHQQETSLNKGILKVLRDPMFHMISLSLAAFTMVVDPALTVIVDYLMDKGHKEDVAKYFISMMSLGDLIGRLGFGWVTDKDFLSVPKFMVILHAGLGVCFLLMPVFDNFDSLMAVIVIYGLISGAILVMFPILVSRYLQSVQSLAIGFMSFFSGVLAFTVPPLIGYFRDRVGSYDGMFYITGGVSVVTGLIWLFEPLLVKLGTKLGKGQNASNVI